MNGMLFYNSFAFRVYSFRRAIHNDNSSGQPCRFFGRLRQGRGRIETKETTIELMPGDVFYIPHDLSYHSYWYPDREGGVVEWESYRFEFVPAERNKCFYFQKVEASGSAMAELDMISKDAPMTVADIGHFYSFLSLVLPRMTELEADPQRVLFEKAEDYIFRNPSFRVPDLAKELGMSESGLYSFFKSYANTTPIKLKNKIQAERAIPMLTFTDLSVEEICDRLGFQSVAHFREIIKEHTGKTPSEIRKVSQSKI